MKIGVIGSGIVAQTLGAKLIELGHDVAIGTRDPAKLAEKKNMAGSLHDWLGQVKTGKVLSFKEAAAHGELLINATHGQISVEALQMADAGRVGPKVLVDVSNELDFGKGMPPAVLSSQERCLAERIQSAFPNLRVVKSLNTMNAAVMVSPRTLKDGDHTVFVSGNDREAKATVSDLLKSFGWIDIVDLGPLSASRGPEMYLAMWVRLWGALQSGHINIKVQR